MPKYRITTTHLIKVTQEAVVESPTFIEAEGVAAARWIEYPTTKKQRETMYTKVSRVQMKTRRIKDA